MNANNNVMNAKGAAAFLGCSIQKVYQLERDGLLKRLPGFSHIRFGRYELERFVGKPAPRTADEPQPQQVQP